MECYRCGTVLGKEDFCPNCGTDVKVYRKIIQASNAYYNQALSKARVRDLSGAIESLKKSLRYNKKNIRARNLLGLVYFETGETVSALGEWVISKNFQSQGNIADEYLDEIQKNTARLESINQTIKKYNQALLYCHQDSKDLAVIQLKKVLSLNPKMVKGHQLLGLLYLEEGNFEQAKKALYNAEKIDKNNITTLRYKQEISERMKLAGSSGKKKDDEMVSYKSGNDTIIRPMTTFKEGNSGSTILNIAIGLILGVLITCFLVVPGVKQSAKSNAKDEILQANDALSSKNQEIKSLKSKVEDLTNQLSEQKDSADSADSKVTSFEQLLEAYIAYSNEDVKAAGDALANVNPDHLSDTSKGIYDDINEKVNSQYLSSLYQEAYKNYNGDNYAEAIPDFEKIVAMDESYRDGNVIYYLAQSYRKNNDEENAKKYYQKVIELYPDTEHASTAQKYLDQMGTEGE